jgi:hypothetical protein
LTIEERFGPYVAVETSNGPVGMTTCRTCGAAVILDSEQAGRIHHEWHARTEHAHLLATFGVQVV